MLSGCKVRNAVMLWREKEGELGRAIVAISEFDTPRERERELNSVCIVYLYYPTVSLSNSIQTKVVVYLRLSRSIDLVPSKELE